MKRKIYPAMIAFALLFGVAVSVRAQRELGVRPTPSGGPLMPEQAAYDVTYYDLTLSVDPVGKSIAGTLTVDARIVHPTAWFVLDLDDPLTVSSVWITDGRGNKHPLRFERREARIWIAFPMTKQPGEAVKISVAYSGVPRVAPRPPWVGGFVWAKTPSGDPWIATACESDGADLWWPCKDHPSDEPDGVALHITVPEPLVCASNGRLRGVTSNGNGTRTFNWYVSTPINNYDVALNIAPYKTVEGEFKSVDGKTYPVTFWVLPEDYDKGVVLFPQMIEDMHFFEEFLGPYPFRADKIGVAHVPYLGMEHQTITAYGANFKNNDYGFDSLLFHELGHEWWGNLVTASDWTDMWIHEGFQSYMDALFAGRKQGEEGYRKYMAGMRSRIQNLQPVAARGSRSATEVYFVAPDFIKSDGDIYGKGALILHTLRYLIGDEAFFKSLRRMAYPSTDLERTTDGRQCRFATTDDFRSIVEEVSGMKLDWFFDVYLRQPKLPRLEKVATASGLILKWDTPNNLPFPMPVEIMIGGNTRRVEMTTGSAVVSVASGEQPVIDPRSVILKAE